MLLPVIFNVIWFKVVLYVNVYVFLAFPLLSLDTTVAELFGELINPVGNWSTISLAYPALFPSLYIANVYVISSLSSTITGSFLCLYLAVVPVFNVEVSILGTLVFATFFPFTWVIYLRKAKSNSSGEASNSVGIVSSSLVTSTIGCSAFNFIELVSSVPFNHSFFFVTSFVTSILMFTFSIEFLSTDI